MTAEELLWEISGKLGQVLDKMDMLLKGTTWIVTPMGEFGFLARVTYGEFLIAVLFCGWGSLWLVRKVTSLLSPGGWW